MVGAQVLEQCGKALAIQEVVRVDVRGKFTLVTLSNGHMYDQDGQAIGIGSANHHVRLLAQ